MGKFERSGDSVNCVFDSVRGGVALRFGGGSAHVDRKRPWWIPKLVLGQFSRCFFGDDINGCSISLETILGLKLKD